MGGQQPLIWHTQKLVLPYDVWIIGAISFDIIVIYIIIDYFETEYRVCVYNKPWRHELDLEVINRMHKNMVTTLVNAISNNLQEFKRLMIDSTKNQVIKDIISRL